MLCLRLGLAVPQVSSTTCLWLGHAALQVNGSATPQVSSATLCLRLGHAVPQVSSPGGRAGIVVVVVVVVVGGAVVVVVVIIFDVVA